MDNNLTTKIRIKLYHLLRWSEKYTKTDMVYLSKNGSWLVIGQLGISLVSFIAILIMARTLSQETYGNYKYVLTLAVTLGAFSLYGLKTITTQATAQGNEGIIKSIIIAHFKWEFILSIIAILLGAYYYTQGNMFLVVGCIIIAICNPILNSISFISAYYNGKKKFFQSAITNIIANGLPITLLAITTIWIQNTLVLVAIFFISSTILGCYLGFIVYNKNLKTRLTNSHGNGLINYGLHLSGMNVMNSFAAQLDKILIFHYLGAPALAIYIFSTAIPKQLRGIIGVINTVAFPKLAAQERNIIIKSVPRQYFIYLLFIIPCIIAYIILAPYIYKIVFPQYMEASFYSQIFILTLLVAGNLSPDALNVCQELRRKYFLHIFSAIILVVSMWLGIYIAGLLGIIIGIVTSKLITSAASLLLVKTLPKEIKKGQL